MESIELVADSKNQFQMIDNYIYLYHVNEFVVMPSYGNEVSDSIQVTYNTTTPLSRSAPIYSYSHSGPRTMAFKFDLHRDMMQEINYGVSNLKVEIGDDYVDTIIKYLQAMALPNYDASLKKVSPPVIAVKLGNEVFFKGVLQSNVMIDYHFPILDNNKYAWVTISFALNEVDAYSAEDVMRDGS